MEPAGRYFKENFRYFVRPKVVECKDAFCKLGRSICGIFGAICLALGFAIAQMRRKK